MRMSGVCYDPYGHYPAWALRPKPTGVELVNGPETAALPILVLRAAALGTVFWIAFLGVRAVLSRVRFTVT